MLSKYTQTHILNHKIQYVLSIIYVNKGTLIYYNEFDDRKHIFLYDLIAKT